jgi:pyruvate/2-oxoglutarate dehydrogenase complex dihydrolipoamide dehydrogenase (E3) component
MVASAKTAYVDPSSADYGVHNGPPITVDMPEMRGRKRAMVDSFRNSNLRRIEATDGLDLIAGEASFTGPKALAVRTNDNQDLELGADNVFFVSGRRPHSLARRQETVGATT